MEDSKTLFCSSKFPLACERISSKFIEILGTRPQFRQPCRTISYSTLKPQGVRSDVAVGNRAPVDGNSFYSNDPQNNILKFDAPYMEHPVLRKTYVTQHFLTSNSYFGRLCYHYQASYLSNFTYISLFYSIFYCS
jgi:hypothetical protein